MNIPEQDPRVYDLSMQCLAAAKADPTTAGDTLKEFVLGLAEVFPELPVDHHISLLLAAVQYWTDTLRDHFPTREEGHCEFSFGYEEDDPRSTQPDYIWAGRIMTARHNDDYDMFQDLVVSVLMTPGTVEPLLKGVCAVLHSVACFHHMGGVLKTKVFQVGDVSPEDFGSPQ